MASDTQAERQRLTSLYGRLSDGELLQLASDQKGLTDIALLVLNDELRKRGIEDDVKPAPEIAEDIDEPDAEAVPNLAEPEMVDFRGFVQIARFRDLPEAQLAQGLLDSAGIESHLFNEEMVRLDWFWSNMLGGIRLLVKPEDAEAASDTLKSKPPEKFNVDDVGEFEQPKCPQCGSMNVSYEELDKQLSYTSLWLGVPIPFKKRAWKCGDCKAEWREEPDPSAADPGQSS